MYTSRLFLLSPQMKALWKLTHFVTDTQRVRSYFQYRPTVYPL